MQQTPQRQPQNRMGMQKIPALLVSMGLPMILSMVLQALYNVVDTMFVINMGADGALGNIALSAAFPVQILMIAIGVGTGVGINAMLSQNLGAGEKLTVNRTAGNGLFLAALFYAVFLAFGLFLATPYMRLMSADETVVKMGAKYLKICCCLSFGSIGFAVAERFLISTGKTLFSMLAQVSGALTNIVLDYVFIYPLGGGVAGAAYATVIGQIVSLVLALIFHYTLNKEIDGNLKYVKPSKKIIKSVYSIGFPAFLMQGMLAAMMFGVLLVIKTIKNEYTVNLLSGSFGIYYKLMQTALFAAFGLSNTLISVVSFNYGMKSDARVRSAIRFGILYSVIVTGIIAVLFQIFAAPVSKLFALTLDESSVVSKSDVISSTQTALHIATLGYLFMGVSVAIQGVLQGFGEIYTPLIISVLRLIFPTLPLVYLFTLCKNAAAMIWWAFPISEVVAAAVSCAFLLRRIHKQTKMQQTSPNDAQNHAPDL